VLTPRFEGISYGYELGFSSVTLEIPNNKVGINEILYIPNGSMAIAEVFDHFSRMLDINGDPSLLTPRFDFVQNNEKTEADLHGGKLEDYFGKEKDFEEEKERDKRHILDKHFFEMRTQELEDWYASDEYKARIKKGEIEKEKMTKDKIREKLFKTDKE